MIQIFNLKDYKQVLLSQIAENKGVLGYKTKLATAAGCQSSFLSHVLHSHVNLTLDHGHGLARFWSFSENETRYFLELINLARASTPELKSYVQDQLVAIRRLQAKEGKVIFSDADRAAIFSSHWSYSAIMTLIEIEKYGSPEAIAKYLRLPISQVNETLEELSRLDLVEKKSAKKWTAPQTTVYLPIGSHFIRNFHANWRSQSVEALARSRKGDIHFSAVHAINSSCFERLNHLFSVLISEAKKAVHTPTNPDELVCITLDLFRPGG
jgi:uncharacterized protein (TIGR02147 family)